MVCYYNMWPGRLCINQTMKFKLTCTTWTQQEGWTVHWIEYLLQVEQYSHGNNVREAKVLKIICFQFSSLCQAFWKQAPLDSWFAFLMPQTQQPWVETFCNILTCTVWLFACGIWPELEGGMTKAMMRKKAESSNVATQVLGDTAISTDVLSSKNFTVVWQDIQVTTASLVCAQFHLVVCLTL